MPTDMEEEAGIDQSRDAALLFKLLTPVSSDDLPLWTQQLPESSKDSHKPLAWAWTLPSIYRCSALPLAGHVVLPRQLHQLRWTANPVSPETAPTRGPPALA